MANDYYNPSGWPVQNEGGDSASGRAEFGAIGAMANKLPAITANGGKVVRVNAGATQLESVDPGSVIDALTGKTTPVDADELPIADSAASFAGKKLTWANLKATVRTYIASLLNMTGAVNEAQTTVASAATPDIWTNTGNIINYTGTATATGFAAAPQAGARRVLDCAGAAVFTAGANMLIDGIASGSNLTVAAGDRVEVYARTTTQFVLRRARQDGDITLGAGSASLAPLTFQSGAVLTTAGAGVEEYDGTAFYFTPVASNRGVALTEHYINNLGTQTGANSNTAQPWFVGTATNGAITLPGNTTYEFEGIFGLSTTGTTSHGLQVGFGGTATLTLISYMVECFENATGLNNAILSSTNAAFLTVATLSQITQAVATATYDRVIMHGTVRINAGGTFIPQFAFTAAPGVAPTIVAGSYFRMRPIGNGSVTSVGNWS